MRNAKGQFIKGHKVLLKWKKLWSKQKKGKPNPKNRHPFTKQHRKALSKAKKGQVPWNYGKGRIKFNCFICQKEVFDKPYRRKKFCSQKCKNLYQHIIRGENHWNYTGTNHKAQRTWIQYKEWHAKVLKRNNYICQVCKKRGGKLQAHHKKSFAKFPKLRFVVSNGLTVHRHCHLKVLHNWKLKGQ